MKNSLNVLSPTLKKQSALLKVRMLTLKLHHPIIEPLSVAVSPSKTEADSELCNLKNFHKVVPTVPKRIQEKRLTQIMNLQRFEDSFSDKNRKLSC